MSDFPATGNWSIYSMQKTLPYLDKAGGAFGAHNYLALVGPDGKALAEMQGVYTRRFTVNGPSPGNYLQVQMWKPDQYMADQSVTSAKMVMSGSEEDMKARFQAGFETAAQALDEKHMLYDGAEIFGHAVNSNSVWNTALKGMGVEDTQRYDGPYSTPGNAVDLRTEPTNNQWIGTAKDPWTPNPSVTDTYSLAPKLDVGSEMDAARDWVRQLREKNEGASPKMALGDLALRLRRDNGRG